jgi:hypothetical protein
MYISNRGAVTGMEKLDYSKIIVDPSKLIKGKRYYAADSIVRLVRLFEEGATSIFDKVKPLFSDENMEVAYAENGMWYSLWYPVEEKYKPYDSPSIQMINEGVIRKRDGKKMDINGYARLDDKLLYIFFRGDAHNYTPEEMFDYFTWEDGTPFGEKR